MAGGGRRFRALLLGVKGIPPFLSDTAAASEKLLSFNLLAVYCSEQAIVLLLWYTVPRLLVEGIAISVNDLLLR